MTPITAVLATQDFTDVGRDPSVPGNGPTVWHKPLKKGYLRLRVWPDGYWTLITMPTKSNLQHGHGEQELLKVLR